LPVKIQFIELGCNLKPGIHQKNSSWRYITFVENFASGYFSNRVSERSFQRFDANWFGQMSRKT
jgi:hypothetical protein